MKDYLIFSLLFMIIHLVCYVIAGIVDLRLARKYYSGKNRLYKSILRDMDDEKENKRIAALLIPSQLIRALLMSMVLYPVLPFLMELSFGIRFVFMASLMFVYADFASAIPFSNTIEGLVYLKKEFVRRRVFWTIHFEAILYSLLFGLSSSWLLF